MQLKNSDLEAKAQGEDTKSIFLLSYEKHNTTRFTLICVSAWGPDKLTEALREFYA